MKNDYFNILDILQSEEAKCYNIGAWLHLEENKLESIRKQASDHSDGMRSIISNWLKRNYDVRRFGPPTWKMLVEAVRAPGGGNNAALADEIAGLHPATNVAATPSYSSKSSIVCVRYYR